MSGDSGCCFSILGDDSCGFADKALCVPTLSALLLLITAAPFILCPPNRLLSHTSRPLYPLLLSSVSPSIPFSSSSTPRLSSSFSSRLIYIHCSKLVCALSNLRSLIWHLAAPSPSPLFPSTDSEILCACSHRIMCTRQTCPIMLYIAIVCLFPGLFVNYTMGLLRAENVPYLYY